MRRPRSTADGDGTSGFTILELLIALTLLAVITVLVLGAISYGRRAWLRVDAYEAAATLPPVQSYLRELLSRMEPLQTADDNGVLSIQVEGHADRLAFVATMEGRSVLGGMYVATLTLDRSEAAADGTLMLTLRPVLNPAGGETPRPALQHRLIEGVAQLRLRYFGALRRSGARVWRDDWQHAELLPELVSLDIAFSRDDPRSWPGLVVAPRID